MLEQQTETKTFDDLATLDEKFEYAKSMHLVAKFDEGLSYFRILKNEYEAVKRYDKVIDCLGWIIQNLGNLGRGEEVYNYLPEYTSYCNVYGTELNQLQMNSYLAFMSTSIGDEKSAIKYNKIALMIANQLQDTKRYMLISLNLQAVYLLVLDLKRAYEISLEVKTLFEQDPSIMTTMSEAAYYLNYITILLEWQQLEEIESLLQRFKQIPNIDKHNRETMYYECVKGRYYNKLERFEEAVEALEKAYITLEETSEEPYLTIVLENLVKAYESMGNYKEALYYANILNARLINQEKKRVLKETIKVTKQLDFENMKQLVYIDGLTSIHNRRYFEEEGTKLVEEASRTSSNIYCAILDIDHFKKINDRFGHIIGDEAIRKLSQVIKDAQPTPGRIFARYGGDEFVFLFAEIERAEEFFQELFNQITNFEFQTDGISMSITISMGVASLNDCEILSLSKLLDCADQALYHSKTAGRNLISFYLK
ncbi:tetratricopeptide repeat-containing diguanylate cyclase [Solibacillus sp. CAU 1738]|uniref:tetratricopeptide repeat-containing diguanylate cyclase n=1 Tax=Solibacillus sp. CAU 1738 TaxID=3140363 RepID=UPI00326138B4